MSRKHLALGAAALVAVAAAAVPGAQGAPAKKKPKTREVRISDNLFTPAKLTVDPGTKVKWVWPDDIGDTHDVTLREAPKGVKKFQSEPGAATYAYAQRLSRPGTYRLICTFHETEMQMTIKVRKPKRRAGS